MKRDSFIIYRSFYEPVKELSDADKGILFDAICTYALDGITTENLSPMLHLAFSFISSTIDRDAEKYKNIVERNRANIGKRWNKKDTKNTTGKSGKIRYSDTGNVNDDDTDDDTDNVNGIKPKYIYSEFYDQQIGLSGNSNEYITFVKYLFGENDAENKLNRVLSIRDQLSFIQFGKILTKSIERKKKLRDMLLDLENNSKYTKGRVSLYSIFNSWLGRTELK
ncbi:MAG TPA: DUF6291 domain-containing protein [Prolixibacteraceae bacterium]|nr:DUF6291 domain-containing protein [Prolixibacteraceae bacterium]